jgi:hypothetical protein
MRLEVLAASRSQLPISVAADRIQDFGADAVAPGQVAAFRLGVQSRGNRGP